MIVDCLSHGGYGAQRQHTNASVVAREAILLKDNLIAVRLQHGQRIWLLREHQPGLAGVAFGLCLVAKKLLVPNLLLRLPVDQIALLYRPSKLYLTKVPAFIELRRNVNLLGAIARDAVWDNARLGYGAAANEASLERPGAIVEDERVLRASWSRDLGFATSRHVVGKEKKMRFREKPEESGMDAEAPAKSGKPRVQLSELPILHNCP